MEPFLAQIVMFAGNFAPRGWAFCDGQLLPISQNTAVFSLIGTIYGGDGRTTFALPDLRGRVPMHPGSGPGLSPRQLGQKGGTETNTVTVNNMPSHTHTPETILKVSNEDATSTEVTGNVLGNTSGNTYSTAPNGSEMHSGAAVTTIANTGGGQAVNNMQPFLCVNFIIALIGTFPSRN